MLLTLLVALASPPASPPALRVGAYSYPRYDRRVALGPLARLVERVAERPTVIVLLDTPDAMWRGEIDVAMTNLGAFVKIRECPQMQAIAVLNTPPAILDGYRGVLLSRRDAGIADLAGLATRTHELRYS